MENMAICVEAPGGKTDFSCLMSDTLPDLHLFGASQCFPFCTYEKAVSEPPTLVGGLLDGDTDWHHPPTNVGGSLVGGSLVDGSLDVGGSHVGGSQYIRRENISDAMLEKFREHYSSSKRAGDEAYSRNPPIIRQLRRSTGSISGSLEKSDIFYYVYGLLHCPSYRERFASDLKKQLPRIPLGADFWTFSNAGRELAALHLNYEMGTMYPLREEWSGMSGEQDTKNSSLTTNHSPLTSLFTA